MTTPLAERCLNALARDTGRVVLEESVAGRDATAADLLRVVEESRRFLRKSQVGESGRDWASVMAPPGAACLTMLLALRAEGVCVAEILPDWPSPLRASAIEHIGAPWLLTAADGAEKPQGYGPVAHTDNWVLFRRAGDAGSPPPSGVTTLAFTGGSDGILKAAMLTDAGLTFVLEEVVQYLGLGDKDVVGSLLPWQHGYGRSVVLSALIAGSRLSVLPRSPLPSVELEALRRRRVSVFAGVPLHYRRWLMSDGVRLHGLRAITVAGGALAEAELRRLPGLLSDSCRIFVMYGLTEMSTRVSYVPPGAFQAKLGSSGLPLREVRVRVDAPAPGKPGELLVTGPNLMAGYWRNSVATAEVLAPGGWLRTGDLARIDEEGYLWILGRAKDVVRRGGETVYPTTLDRLALSCPGVADAVAIGRHRPCAEDDLLLFIVAGTGAFDEAVLRQRISSTLGPLYLPSQVRVVPSIPRSPVGKILRDALIKEADNA